MFLRLVTVISVIYVQPILYTPRCAADGGAWSCCRHRRRRTTALCHLTLHSQVSLSVITSYIIVIIIMYICHCALNKKHKSANIVTNMQRAAREASSSSSWPPI